MHTDEIVVDADAVAAHLARNDIPRAFLRVSLKALECVHEKHADRRLKLPTNIVMPAGAIVERLHLGGFLQMDKIDGD